VNKSSNLKTTKDHIKSISPAYIYYALAFLSKGFEAYKTARFSFEKLNTMKFPLSWQSKIDFEIMSIRSKPYIDKDNSMPLCYRCLNTNPLINLKGDKCTTCSAKFIRSPISFEILPLIEFKPTNEISDDTAIEIIKNSSSNIKMNKQPASDVSTGTGATNLMIINHDDNNSDDIFGMKIVEWCESKVGNEDYGIFEVDEETLKSLNENEVNINLIFRYL